MTGENSDMRITEDADSLLVETTLEPDAPVPQAMREALERGYVYSVEVAPEWEAYRATFYGTESTAQPRWRLWVYCIRHPLRAWRDR